MYVESKLIMDFLDPYAICVHNTKSGPKVICGTINEGPGIRFNPDGSNIETLWTGPGGTMTILPLGQEDRYYVTQGFFRNFNAKTAKIVLVQKDCSGAWKTINISDLPYLHRFCLVETGGKQFILGSTLSGDKKDLNDWSIPGKVYIAPIGCDYAEPLEFRPILEGLARNHGMDKGQLNGRDVVIVTGDEGAFVIDVPRDVTGEWRTERIIEGGISDVRILDIDNDGTDELITIETFHGDTLNVYKENAGKWEKIYTYPTPLGHGIWTGTIFNKPGIIVGYRKANEAILLLTKNNKTRFSLDAFVIDEYAPAQNIALLFEPDKVRVYAACQTDCRIMMYVLHQ